MTCGLNGRLNGKLAKWNYTKWQVGKSIQMSKLIKWQVDKMTCRLIAKWTKQKVDKM